MLDTNIVSHVLRYPTGSVAQRLMPLGPDDCCISIITLAELRFGASKVKSEGLSRQIDGFIALAPALPFSPPVEVAYAEIRARLELEGPPIGPADLFIAAHGLALDLTLVTANVREFSRVPGLRLENWLD